MSGFAAEVPKKDVIPVFNNATELVQPDWEVTICVKVMVGIVMDDPNPDDLHLAEIVFVPVTVCVTFSGPDED